MHCADEFLPRVSALRCHGKQGHADGEDTSKITGDGVPAIVTFSGQQEDSDGPQASNKDIAHVGVVVSADRALHPGPLQEELS